MIKEQDKFIIGITGISGSGKTTISKKLASKLKAKLIHLDDFWKYHNTEIPSRQDWEKWEHPSSIDFDKLYKEIVKEKKKVNRKRIIIFEGFHVLYNKKIRGLLDLKIYITLPDKFVIKRRVDKFGREDNQEWYSKNIVVNSYTKYGKPTKKYADLIIRGNDNTQKNIRRILEYLRNKVYM